ncbi:MAG: hypothetical protein HYS35_02055 [Betaproteobacteria bacterium]|nr:hypothetical protein [Betaproteobacteria bacterium]
MSDKPGEGREANPLIQRVDALMRRQQEDSQRAVQEVPLLTEVVEPEAAAAAPEARPGDEALVEDIERVLVVRLVPELNRQIAGLRSELEKELRRAVREAVAHAIAVRKVKPGKS